MEMEEPTREALVCETLIVDMLSALRVNPSGCAHESLKSHKHLFQKK